MDNKTKRFDKAFLLFLIGQVFMMLGLIDYASSIKVLSDWLFIFSLLEIVGVILMIVASTMLYEFNKNYFYFFITSVICLFVNLLATFGEESTEDLTIAVARGLGITGDILLCVSYVYFFLGTRDYFLENELDKNAKRCKYSCFVVVILTIVINLMSFIRTVPVVQTNVIAASIFKYGCVAIKLGLYVYIFVILLLMKKTTDKKRKETNNNEKE